MVEPVYEISLLVFLRLPGSVNDQPRLKILQLKSFLCFSTFKGDVLGDFQKAPQNLRLLFHFQIPFSKSLILFYYATFSLQFSNNL